MSRNLSNFEDADMDDDATSFSLPRRSPKPTNQPAQTSPLVEDPVQPAGEGSGAKDPSNIQIPTRLIGPLTAARTGEQMSNGDLFIRALEEHYDQLETTFRRPTTTTGGRLFSARTTRAPRQRNTEPVSPVNYRMSSEDYSTLDALVTDLGAASRSHLISRALELWLAENDYLPNSQETP